MQNNLEEVLKKSLFALLSISILFVFEANSQKRKQIEYSGFFDSYYYRGPLNVHVGFVSGALPNSLQINSPRFNLGASYKVWPRTYFGVDINYVKINFTRDTLGNKGSSNGLLYIYEFNAYCRFHLLDRKILFKNDINKRPQRIRPYIMLGIGAIYYDHATSLQNLVKGSIQEGGGIGLSIPATLGFAIYLNKRFSLLAEGGYHYVLGNLAPSIKNGIPDNTSGFLTASLKLQYSFVPFKRKKQKYKGPPLAPAGSGPQAAPIKKDSTLNDPILPPGAPEPEKKEDLNAPIPAPGSGQGDNAPIEAPKELTEEEKKKKQEEEEQKQWENSWKEDKSKPADKKKKEEPSGW